MSSLGSVDATNLCISLYVNFVVLSKIFWLMTNKIMKIVDAVSNNFTVLNSGNNKIRYKYIFVKENIQVFLNILISCNF